MTDTKLVRVVIEQQLTEGVRAARTAIGERPEAKRDTDDFRRRVEEARERVRRRAIERREASGGLSRLGPAGAGAVAGAVAGTMAKGGNAANKLSGASIVHGDHARAIAAAGIAGGPAGALLMGGAVAVEQLAPLVMEALIAPLNKALAPLGVQIDRPGAAKTSDTISEAVSEFVNKVVGSIAAAGSTAEVERAKLRLGGSTSPDQIAATFFQYQKVYEYHGRARDRFARDIGRDMIRQLSRLAFGGS